MGGTLTEMLRGRRARRGTLAPWARALAEQPMPGQMSDPLVGMPDDAAFQQRYTAQRWAAAQPPEPGPMPRPQMPMQALDDPSMPPGDALPYPPPAAPPVPRSMRAPSVPQMGGLTADDLNALMLQRLGMGEAPAPRAGLSPEELERARMRIAAFGIGGYGGV